ncbi:MAG: MFS transporter [Patescibacteria group bacterium]
MEKNLQANVWKYTLLLISNKRVFVAILGAYYLTIPGVTPQWIGTILLAGSLAGFLFEIPSGYVSDKIGHKKALVISRALMLISTILFLVADKIIFLVLASIFMSVSNAFHSGTGSAFMHETLRGLNREKDYSRIMGKVSSIGFAVPIILMVLIPFLVSISYKIPFVISLVIDLIGLFTAISLVKPSVPQENIEEINATDFRQVMREGYHLKFFRFAVFSGIIGGMLIGVSAFRAPYQLIMEIPVIWFGVFFGIGRALASLMLAYSGKIKELTNNIYHFYKLQLVLYSILILILGTVSVPWVVVIVFIVVNAFQWGLSQADTGYLLEIIRTSKFKATLLSVCSQIDKAFMAISGFGLGFAIERLSYSLGFLYLGIAFVALLLPLYLYIIKNKGTSLPEPLK